MNRFVKTLPQKVPCTNTNLNTANEIRFNLWKVSLPQSRACRADIHYSFQWRCYDKYYVHYISSWYSLYQEEEKETARLVRHLTSSSYSHHWSEKKKKKEPQSLSLAWKRWSVSTHATFQSSVTSHGGEPRRSLTSYVFVFVLGKMK